MYRLKYLILSVIQIYFNENVNIGAEKDKVRFFWVKSTKSKFDFFAGYNTRSGIVRESFDNNELLFLIAQGKYVLR